MKPLQTNCWNPADGMNLEENALLVAKKSKNYLVVAGPGAGKTELLAQRACFLLQTNTCKFPHKILAISFKKDAAYNLKERVIKRCADELSKRFDSYTFDSFAKQLLDRFIQALPDDFKINPDYDIIHGDQFVLDLYESENAEYRNTTHKKTILAFHHAKLPFSNDSLEDEIRMKVWKKMIQQSKLSFAMVMRLAEYIVISNKNIRMFLQQTYHFVFLDEFQDTTEIQYDFFKSCFLTSKSIFTAVGDDKQRIMIWAGARKTIFEDFIAETGATRIPLTRNFRCAPRLVTLLNHLTQNLLGKTDFATPSPKWNNNQGECFVWFFENPADEMEILFQEVKKWIEEDGIDARNICILVKQQLEQYVGELINYFNQYGIKARDENIFQDILSQELPIFIINTLYVIFQKKSQGRKQKVFTFLSNLHTELEDEQLLKLEIALSNFIKATKDKYKKTVFTDQKFDSLIDEIIDFAGQDRIRVLFPQYKNPAEFTRILVLLRDEFLKNYETVNDMVLALDMLIGEDTIPVMTIHKSKGLEYHTVIFIGLEDGAFWSFQQQEDEDKCAFFVALSRAKERVVFTFSQQRPNRFGNLATQYRNNIEILFQELENSGIVEMSEKNID